MKIRREILICGMLGLLLTACSSYGGSEDSGTTQSITSDSASSSTEAVTPDNNEISEKTHDVIIHTTYTDLMIPEAFSDCIETFTEDEGNSVRFVCIAGEQEIPVYTISFGIDVGTKIGTLAADGSNIEVFLKTEDPDISSLTEDEQNTVLAARETVNNVIESLTQNDNFQSAGE